MIKSKASTLIVFTVILLICLIAVTSGLASEIKLILGHSLAADHPYQNGLELMAKIVNEETNGAVEIKIFPAEQLGKNLEMVEAVKSGVQDMGLDCGNIIPSAPSLGILQAIMLFRDKQHLYNVLEGPIGAEIYQSVSNASGLKMLQPYYFGSRQITTNIPINSIKDLQGVKIRTPQVPPHMEGFKAIGMNPTPMAFSEVYLALKTGAIDGQDNPLSTIFSSRFYEVQKYIAMTSHMIGVNFVYVNEKKWNSLSDEVRTIILDALKKGAELSDKLVEESEESLIAELKARGVSFTYPDPEPFSEAAKSSWKIFEEIWGQGLAERIAALK